MRSNGQVLVLNENYEPLNLCSWQRAVILLYLGKAVCLEHDSRLLRSASASMRQPLVVRLADQVKRPLPQVKLTRASLMARDEHTCQYCGKQSKHLTMDHVVPRERGGPHAWENVVACCVECNNYKGNRTPREAGLTLRRAPQRPRFIPYLSLSAFRRALRVPTWRDYLEPFAPHLLPD